jgi:multisubunit Na+/H+ antiporter MnhC subunit
VIGFAILLYVLINAKLAAQALGLSWLGVGVVLVVILLATGREPQLKAEENL